MKRRPARAPPCAGKAFLLLITVINRYHPPPTITRYLPSLTATLVFGDYGLQTLKCSWITLDYFAAAHLPPAPAPLSSLPQVTALDLSRLDSDEFLNDTVIDFYLR